MGSRLIFIEDTGKNKWGAYTANYRCQCGTKKEIAKAAVKSERTLSCGCLMREKVAEIGRMARTHGMTGSREFSTWSSMKSRCGMVGTVYENIAYCDSWDFFENFYRDMGERPEGTTLDRINTDGNYEASNCRWANWDTQSNNKKKTIFLTHNGIKLSVAQWTRKLGLGRTTMYDRIKRGHKGSLLFMPAQKRGTNQHTSVFIIKGTTNVQTKQNTN